MDTERTKHLINELNVLLNKNYNILSFDLLQPIQLLQPGARGKLFVAGNHQSKEVSEDTIHLTTWVLSDTLSYIDGSGSVDIQQEDLEETVFRMMEMLRILKYRLELNVSPSMFRQGIVQGDKKIIHPILDWLVTNMADLKKRSYLAQYLVKLEIPIEISTDPDIVNLYEQYEELISNFMSVHKESELLKETTMAMADLKTDLKTMEAERDSVVKKIDKMKRQVENHPEKDKLLDASRALRLEYEKRKELMEHESQQQSQLAAAELKLERLSAQLRDIRRSPGRYSPDELLRRLEEETQVNLYLAEEKLPQEIAAREQDIRMYEMIIHEPSLSRAHLDDLNFKIQQVSAEVNQMLEAQLADQSPGEDKNAPFRQQAAIISRKKDAKAEQLSELRANLAQLEEELVAKQKQLHEVAGETVLRGDDLKKYVSKLRVKGAQYKKQKAQLAALKTEAGILTRTLEILAARDQTVLQALAEEEARHGIEGYRETRDMLETVSETKSGMDIAKGQTLEEMSKLVVELNRRVNEKKSQLEPLIVELQPLRERYAETKDQYEQQKKVYDATASSLENASALLQQEVEKLQNEFDATEKEIERLKSEIEKAEGNIIKVQEEVKLYVSGSVEAKKNSLREQLQQKIGEQEKLGKQLKEEQATLKDLQSKNAQQVRYWMDVERLFKCKLECLEDENKNGGVFRRERGAETLTLPQ